MSDLLSRISTDPEKCGGDPIIRGMRITVDDIMRRLHGGQGEEEILSELPELEVQDIDAARLYANIYGSIWLVSEQDNDAPG